MSEDDWTSLRWHLNDGRHPFDWYEWEKHEAEINKEYPALTHAAGLMRSAENIFAVTASAIFTDH